MGMAMDGYGALCAWFAVESAYSTNSQMFGFPWGGCWSTSYSLHCVR